MPELDVIKQKYEMLRSAMDERLNRLWAASEAIVIGWGGVTLVAEATGISRPTISRGIRELRELGLVPAMQAAPERPLPKQAVRNNLTRRLLMSSLNDGG
jgi:DNA-binding transcriptional ArsR family regulator